MTEEDIRKIVRDEIQKVISENDGLISPDKIKDDVELIYSKEKDDIDKEIISPREDDRGSDEILEKDE